MLLLLISMIESSTRTDKAHFICEDEEQIPTDIQSFPNNISRCFVNDLRLSKHLIILLMLYTKNALR